MTDQERRAALNISVYCQDHGALPGERCTPSMRACSRRKQTAREIEAERIQAGAAR